MIDPFEQAALAEDAKKTLVTYAQLGQEIGRQAAEVLDVEADPVMALHADRRRLNEKRLNRSTNRTFAEDDGLFKSACQMAGVKPTMRQASKYRMRKGAAWKSREVNT